ncbi:protein-L-isoaspartate O-methyltransferase family protein [Leptospira haakeii]|uniref:Protein-L-isoaspartate O-methyltransferase n=1 Tax=Leptospira haakeii TaxID=2023198 RepID=A0ABX4PHX1_9LEPT|nr:protein-L-isoaspartate O-methyltransferase [Leptospira haakeii]PKA14486.1 protein-L-isoaspartate(D-aspartate) O-methyltransferase [Leptospira haakeii]PKA18418.1 protein-L-isoaspartate(D-aspartate) O-methyltransferase [Leptospira haakeii]
MENSDLGFVSRFDTAQTVLAREKMVRTQISDRGIKDPNLLSAFLKIPRHIFLPEKIREHSYEDKAVPIGEEQTISQPYIVAYITDQLQVRSGDIILEIGTGSGYLAAILDLLGARLLSLEIVPELYERSLGVLEDWSPGFTKRNKILLGDALLLTQTKGKFSKFVSSACFPKTPGPGSFLFESLPEEGIAVLPVEWKEEVQLLLTLRKKQNRFEETNRLPVKFVPLLGRIDLV